MVLSLWANEMFRRKSENANQLIVFINFFSEMSSKKFYSNRRRKTHFSYCTYIHTYFIVLSTTQLKDKFSSVFSMMPIFNLVVTTAKHH